MPVNEQVTDSVTQVNTKVVGETPAMAMGNLLMSASQGQQQSAIRMQTETIQDLNSLMPDNSEVGE